MQSPSRSLRDLPDEGSLLTRCCAVAPASASPLLSPLSSFPFRLHIPPCPPPSPLCRLGFNRTGFIMASYLVQQYGLSVDAALAAFREARPPGVRHAHFMAELRRRYELHTSHTCASLRPSPALAEVAGAEEVPAPQPSPALMSGWLRDAAGQGGYAATPGSLLSACGGGSGSARQRVSGRLLVVEGDGEGGGSRVVMIEKNESLDLSLAQVGLAPLA